QQTICGKSGDDLDAAYNEAMMFLRGNPELGQGELVRSSKKIKFMPQNPIPYPTHRLLQEVADAMRYAFAKEGDTFSPQDVITSFESNHSFGHLGDWVEYLDGFWVEELALTAFHQNREKAKLHDYASSIQTNQVFDFEFDVAAMQGYQLYAVSCTRSAIQSVCKNKLFELLIRARQLGGDEARVGLVCGVLNPMRLQQAVEEQWRVGENNSRQGGNIRVFGASDLEHLPERFYDWLVN
ncbi:MAG: hypothetical protein AAF639_43685, partial [Chloroflexota bacterium]